MATIVQRPGNVKSPYTVRYVDPNTGRQREKSFRLKRDALDFKAKFEHDSRAQIFVDPARGNERFRETVARWQLSHPGRQYASILKTHILPAMGDRTLSAVAQDREGMLAFLASLSEKVGPSMVRTSQVCIGMIMRDAVESGRIANHRLTSLPSVTVPGRVAIVDVTSAQLETLAAELHEYGFVVWLLRGCGLRIGEALAVRGDQLTNGVLRITDQLRADRTYGPLKHRKAGDYRDIPLPAYVSQRKPERGEGRLWPQAHHRRFRDRWQRACKRAGLPAGFTPHHLRHLFASDALAAGIPITDVAKWLGHQNIQVTFGIYGHLVPDSFDRGRAVLDARFESLA